MKAAIFDMDGTLLDSMPMWGGLVREYVENKGIVCSAESLRDVESLALQPAAAYFAEHFLQGETAQSVLEDWSDYVVKGYATAVVPKPGVMEYLERLKQKDVKMCVATLTDRYHAQPVLERLGMSQYFEFLLTVPEAGKDKRFPDIYLQAAERMQLAPKQCVVFEDSFYAARTAKSAGFVVYGVFDPHHKGGNEKLRQVSDRFVESFEQLL
ncbi:MAG: HAD family hydrolase [Christensenellales bacterium]